MAGETAVVQRWDLAKHKAEKAAEYEQLFALIEGSTPLIRNTYMADLAKLTSSPENLMKILKSMTGESKASKLRDLLQKIGGEAKLIALAKGLGVWDAAIINEVVSLEPNPDLILEIQDVVKGNVGLLLTLLRNTSGEKKGQDLKDALNLAGGFNKLLAVKSFSSDISVLLMLLRKTGSGDELAKFVPLVHDGQTLVDFLALTDAASALVLMGQHAKASLAELKRALIDAKLNAAGPKADCTQIRFTQVNCSSAGEGYSVHDNIERLRKQPHWDIPAKAIRVFLKTPEMDAWGPMTFEQYTGDPKNLENGQLYTLDNRRLAAYRRAGRTQIPKPQIVGNDVVSREVYKFSTKNKGVDIAIN